MKARKKKKRTIWILATAFVIAAVILGGSFLQRQRARADADLESDQIVTAFIGSLSAEASASGQLLPQREASLSMGAAGQVERVLVETGDKVQAGDVLIQLESKALERSVRSAEQTLVIQEANLAQLFDGASEEDVAAARAAVDSAKAQLDDLLAGPGKEDLAATKAALASAQAQLDDLLAGPSAEDLERARVALASARATAKAEAERYAAIDAQTIVARQQLDMATVTLENARYFYDALANDWQHKDYAPFSPEAKTLQDAQTNYNVALARYNLSVANINNSAYRSAQAQVAQAEASLAALTEEQTVQIASAREQVAQARASMAALTEEQTVQIASARSQLAQSEANLYNLLKDVSEEKLAITEAQVAQARIALANAQARLAEATLVAPFDGIITAVHVAVGERTSGSVVDLVDVDSLEVVLGVDEVDIGSIALGQPTIITLEAWPNQQLEGKVTAIAPRANVQSELVIYEVHIGFDKGDLLVRTGMTANADLITAEKDDVLLVPNRAIIADRSANMYYVYLEEGDELTKVEVTIGLRDDRYTEITGGLEKGDKVAVDHVEESVPFGPGQGGGHGM